MSKKKAVYTPASPQRPQRSGDWRWPAPTPLPSLPPEDTGRVLKQILDRLDAIEKRLENIEKMLVKSQRVP